MSDRLTSTADQSAHDRRRKLEALLRKKAEKSRTFPLSFAQQRLWILDRLDPGNPVYNVPMAMRLRGPLDLDALSRTLTEVVARHESLRTKIVMIDDQPMQVVEPAKPQMVTIIDLEHVEPAQREAEAVARAQTEARKPFRLDESPLFRTLLLRCSSTEHVLVVVMHHIISDDWSITVLLREVALLYQAFRAGQPSPLEPLPVQYADYAVWQRQRLQGEKLQGLLDYWRPRLQDLAPLELPADRPRVLQGQPAGATECMTLPVALADRLRELGRREGATLYMTLLAALQTLLYRYSGQEDFAIGSPIAGRSGKEIEGLVGFFVNTLVLRADLSGNPTFHDLLGRVRQTALDAFQHQDLPFERLVDALNPERDADRNPLFQVMFALQNAPWPELKVAGLAISVIPLDTGMAKFELLFTMREEIQGLSVLAEYDAHRFQAVTIQDMLKRLQILLEAIVADPDRRIAETPLLAEAERRRLLVEWNDTAKDYQSTACLHQQIEAQVARSPAAVAVDFEGQQLTFAELNRKANQLARHLARYNVQPDTPVGVCLERSPEMVVSLLAILKAGGAYGPLDPDYPPDRLGFMIADSRPAAVLTTRTLAARLPAVEAPLVCLDEIADALAQEDSDNLSPCNALDDVAYVIYTSGSTGRPKGVRNTHRGICNRLAWMQDAYGLTSRGSGPAENALQLRRFGVGVLLAVAYRRPPGVGPAGRAQGSSLPCPPDRPAADHHPALRAFDAGRLPGG